jgi:hypothetical protein
MPYICKRRSDIPDGILQVLDLQPNESQRNLIYEPPGQTKYVNDPQNDTVVVAANITVGAKAGVAAWLIDTIEDSGDGGALSATQANTIAAALLVAMRAGATMTTAAVNTIIQLTVAASGIGVGDSVGTLAQLLRILAGAEYVVPAGTGANVGAAAFKDAAAGAFTTGQYRATYDSGALNISLGEGHLASFISSAFEYGGTTGAALVVYSDTGTVMT